ncbi:MAG: DUF2809 domain-containing protein [Gemmatimonadota bacterium]
MGRRLRYLLLAILTILVGLPVHQYGLGFGPAARDMLGDVLWATMIVWWVSVLAPQRSLAIRAAVALAICFAVEFSQLLHAPWLDALRATLPGHLVLGSDFHPRDLLAYSGGVLLAAAIDRILSGRLQAR